MNNKIKIFNIVNEIKTFKPHKIKHVLCNGSLSYQYNKQKFNNIPPRHLFPGESQSFSKKPHKQFLLKEKERRAELSKKWKEEAKVYEQCIECDKPKYTEKQRKFKLCYDCYQSEIHGWSSSDDETELFIGSLSIS